MSEADDPHSLSRRTTPTWEVELLISGVAVFAMLQLPGWLDNLVFSVEPRIDEDWRLLLMLFYIYSKSAAIVLAATFALHLLLRAQWIALVGMHSVYPQGVRLDRLKMGPIQRAIEEGRNESTSDAIERADNRASVVFAIGVTVASIITSVCVAFCGVLLLATVASNAFGWRINAFSMMAAIFAIFMVPFAAAVGIDQTVSARLPPDGIVHRGIAALLRFYTRIGMGRRNNQIVAILTSNGGERKMMAIVMEVMLAALMGVSTTYFAMRSGEPLGSYAQFPEAGARAVEPGHYDDQRDPTRDNAKPYVQSAVVVGPYLKLMVPYRPRIDEAAMRNLCGAKTRGLGGDALAATRLACLQSLHGVTLDGKPIADLRYEIASDPRTDRPALLAMIDVRALAKGRHELRIARPLRGDRKPEQDEQDPGYDAIPFWR